LAVTGGIYLTQVLPRRGRHAVQRLWEEQGKAVTTNVPRRSRGALWTTQSLHVLSNRIFLILSPCSSSYKSDTAPRSDTKAPKN
jgi:hypothetical protein